MNAHQTPFELRLHLDQYVAHETEPAPPPEDSEDSVWLPENRLSALDELAHGLRSVDLSTPEAGDILCLLDL